MLDENKEYVEIIEAQEEPATLKYRLANLLSIKSLVTVIFTLVFSYLSIIRVISGEQFIILFTTIIAFYFGVQSAKGHE